MKDKKSKKYEAFKNVEQLQYFLAKNEKFLNLLVELDLKIDEAGAIRVPSVPVAVGCPFGDPSRCGVKLGPDREFDPRYNGRVLWGKNILLDRK